MSIRLRELIRAVRSCKTMAEERDVIAKESAAIRTAFKDEDTNLRHRNVAKLLFLHLLGYPTAFGQMECLKLIASGKFPEKRIGYLGLMVLLDERQEVLMLVTNSLKNDLNHQNQYISGLALCALGNIGSPDMTRDLGPEVEKLLQTTNPYIRKKAALCAIRIIKKNPELAENFVERIRNLLNDRNHGVLLAGVTSIIELLDVAPQFIPGFRRSVPALIRILKSLVMSGYAPEHDVYGITDPFLQVKILRLLAILGKGSPEASEQMSDMLAQITTNTENSKTAGNAILYEAVLTIMSIQCEQSLRAFAINVLGRFLANRDNNIRYVALNTLSRVVAHDVQAVQRHRTTVIECLKDADISIRRRALDLAYALINDSNIKLLARELLNFLIVADVEFKPDLTAKICAVVDRYAPSLRWQVDTLIQVLTYAGEYVREEIPASFVAIVAQNPDLHEYAVRRLYNAIKTERSMALVQVAAWVIGEFGDSLVRGSRGDGELDDPVTEGEVLETFRDILASPLVTDKTREYILTALVKLSSRFHSNKDRISALIGSFKRSIHLDIQQRACEFGNIMALDSIRAALLEPMPVPEKPVISVAETAQGSSSAAAAESSQNGTSDRAAASSASAGSSKPASSQQQNVTTKPAPVSAAPAKSAVPDLLGLGDDLLGPAPTSSSAASSNVLDLLGGFGGGMSSSTAASAPAAGSSAGSAPKPPLSDANMLLDLLGTGPSAPAPAPAAAPSMMQQQQQLQQQQMQMQQAAMMGMNPMMMSTPMNAAAPAAGGDPNRPFAPIVGYQKGGLTISFDFLKAPGNPSMTKITATFRNTNMHPLQNFTFLAAVPKYLKMQLLPASSATLNPNDNVTQVINIANSMHGQKPVMLRIKLEYDENGNHVLEQADVPNLPAAL